MNRCHAV